VWLFLLNVYLTENVSKKPAALPYHYGGDKVLEGKQANRKRNKPSIWTNEIIHQKNTEPSGRFFLVL
jgi:hypothetical protein